MDAVPDPIASPPRRTAPIVAAGLLSLAAAGLAAVLSLGSSVPQPAGARAPATPAAPQPPAVEAPAPSAPPALALPPDVTLEASGPDGAVVVYAARARDSRAGPVAIRCSPRSGSTFPLGRTAVTCEAGRGDATARGGFTVTVRDTTAPSASFPGDQTVEAAGPGGATAVWEASAWDAVDGAVPVRCAPASGSLFPRGETAVACTAADRAGNRVRGGFTVTVRG